MDAHGISARLASRSAGWSRSRVGADPNTDQFAAFGIGGYNPTDPLNGGLPQSTNIDRLQRIGANDWLPSKEYNNVWDFIQNVAINKGTHALKFGAEYRPIKFPFFQVPYPHGDWTFDRRTTPRSRPVDRHSPMPDRRCLWPRSCSVRSSRPDFHDQLHLVAEERLGLLRTGRLEGHAKLTFNFGLPLRTVLAHRRAFRPAVELRSTTT